MKRFISILMVAFVLLVQVQCFVPSVGALENIDVYFEESFSSSDYELNKAYTSAELKAINDGFEFSAGVYAEST